MQTNLSRRDVMAGLSATGLAAVATPVLAKAPLLNTQAPNFYRFKIGAIEATVVSDGPLELGAPQPELFKGVTKEEFGKALTDNFLPTDSLRLEQNALVINTGDKLVLIDTGTGGRKFWSPFRQTACEPESRRHRPEGHRRGRAHPRASGSLLGPAR